MTSWHVVVTPEAKKHLAAVKDAKVQKELKDALERLKEDPDKRGKPLREKLMGYRSLRVVGGRYRIIYQHVTEKHKVCIVTVGIRKAGSSSDAYEVAQRLVKRQGKR